MTSDLSIPDCFWLTSRFYLLSPRQLCCLCSSSRQFLFAHDHHWLLVNEYHFFKKSHPCFQIFPWLLLSPFLSSSLSIQSFNSGMLMVSMFNQFTVYCYADGCLDIEHGNVLLFVASLKIHLGIRF